MAEKKRSPARPGSTPPEQSTNGSDAEPDRAVRDDDGATAFLCAICGEVAGRLRVFGGGETVNAGPVVGPMRFKAPAANLSGFIGVITVVISRSTYAQLRRILSQERPLTLDVVRLARDLVPFFCRQCLRTYCRSHWDLWEISTSTIIGYCPHRHRQLVDD
jgi:hypothetical protein